MKCSLYKYILLTSIIFISCSSCGTANSDSSAPKEYDVTIKYEYVDDLSNQELNKSNRTI